MKKTLLILSLISSATATAIACELHDHENATPIKLEKEKSNLVRSGEEIEKNKDAANHKHATVERSGNTVSLEVANKKTD